MFSLHLLSTTNSHVAPSSSIIAVVEGKPWAFLFPIQLFMCKATEHVVIRWLDGPLAIILKEVTKNQTHKLSFIPTTHPNGSQQDKGFDVKNPVYKKTRWNDDDNSHVGMGWKW